MSNEIKLLEQLLPQISEYVKEHENADPRLFSIYLKDRLFEIDHAKKGNLTPNDYLNYDAIPQVAFSAMLTRLYRFATRYLKQTFKDRNFKTIDEFGFMATLLKEKQLSKSELINKHLMELTTGVELIKRLVKKGLLEEFDDPRDKRSKLVALTDLGKKELFSVFNDMYDVSLLISGNMTDDEMKSAIELFTKLSQFHEEIFEKDKNASLEEIYSRYLP